MDYAKFLRRVTIFFVCFLVVLTFFARTLVDINLPRVSTAFISTGVVSPEAISSGVAARSVQTRLFAPASGIVTGLLAVGDVVNVYSEEVLFTITTDLDVLMDRLQANEHERSVNALQIEQASQNRMEAELRLIDLRTQPLVFPNEPVLSLWELESQIEANARSIAVVREDISALQILYDTGAIPRIDITRREADLYNLLVQAENLSISYENAHERHETELINHQNTIDRIRRERNEQLRSLESSITGHDFAIARAELDAIRIENQHGNIMEQILAGGAYEYRKHYVDYELFVVLELNPAIHIGSFITENTWVMTVSPLNDQFTVYANFSHVHDLVFEADIAFLHFGDRVIRGYVTRVQPQGAVNRLQISVDTPFLSGGELVRVNVRRTASVHDYTVPLVALRQDDRGYFIMYVVREEARFGSRYVLHAARVTVQERDASIAAVSFLDDLEIGPVVLRSDAPVFPGSRVRLTAPYSFVPAR